MGIDKILGLHVCFFFFIRNLRIRIEAGRSAVKDFRERQDFHENESVVISSRNKSCWETRCTARTSCLNKRKTRIMNGKYFLCLAIIASAVVFGQTGADECHEFDYLVGTLGSLAKDVVEAKCPALEVYVLKENSPVTMDLRPNRLRIFVNEKGYVAEVPYLAKDP